MKKYKLNLEDLNYNFFHFTREKNLISIESMGLLPKISFHAQALEDTEKVFFVEGLDNLLILFDCWINVCSKYPFIPGMFNLEAIVMRYKWFPKAIVNAYFKWTEINKLHKFIAYKYFDRFLRRYVLLNVNLEEGIDFSFDDIDQIKARGYRKEYLVKGGYSLKYSDLNSVRMDRWNLHTFSNHGVSVDKIKLCYVGDSYKMLDVLKFALNHTKIDVESICPVLYGYLISRKYIS